MMASLSSLRESLIGSGFSEVFGGRGILQNSQNVDCLPVLQKKRKEILFINFPRLHDVVSSGHMSVHALFNKSVVFINS